MADDTRPLRALGPDDPQPPVDPLDLRQVRDLTIPHLFELVARRMGVGAGTGEITIELVFRGGKFVRGHKHETLPASSFDVGDSSA